MRADLLALTPETVAVLANLGLVKRALREIEEGKGPTLTEEADGTVVGLFASGSGAESGVTTRLPPGRPLSDTQCTCPAPGVCRHRVAVALAYRTFASGERPSAAPPAPVVMWSPSEIDDAAIVRVIGKRALEEARGIAQRGIVVEVLRSTASGEPPTARLPSCTVRFLVPKDIVYARCDCALTERCAHVALAVWAFRQADTVDATRGSLTLELRQGASAKREQELDADGLAVALALDITATGVIHAREALAQRFVLARESLAKGRHTWTACALDDLELALERYRARSARYRAGEVLSLLAEIVARGRAARAEGTELPASSILGRGEAMETKLDHLRLVGLGCRFDADDRERSVEILLADPDTGTVLVMDKTWTFPAGETVPEAPELSRRRLHGASVAGIAKGEMVTRVAKRRANRALTLGVNREGQTSVTPQTGDLSILPRPLRVDRLAELDAHLRMRAPRLVRPRVRAEDVHAVKIAGIDHVVFDAAEQTLIAHAHDEDDQLLLVRRVHRGAAPGAIDALGRVLLGAEGAVRWIAGPVRREPDGLTIEPTLVVADRVVTPDVEEVSAVDLPLGRVMHAASPIGGRLEAAWRALEETVQLGALGLTAAHEGRLSAAAKGLTSVGLASIGERVQRAAESITLARRAASRERAHDAARAILDAAIRLDLAREAHASGGGIPAGT